MSVLPRLVRNTMLSAAAFLVTGAIGIVLVPLLINAYGMAAFGLIALGRTLLPTGALAILDFGMSETATQAVGRARGSSVWSFASEQLTLLLAVSVVLGTALGVLLIVTAPALGSLFRAEDAFRVSFVEMVRVTGASLLVLFPALVVEGVLKGFERFGWLRFWEVVSMSLYGIAVVLLIHWNFTYEWTQYALIGALLVRYAALSASAVVASRDAGLRFRIWSRDAAAEVRRRSLLMLQNKFVSTLQTQAPPLVAGALVGPAGVAVYDVVTRLPRFLKPVLSLLASAIFPVSARLVGAGADQQVRRISATSFWLLPLLIFPPLLGAMLVAKPILVIWVGEQFAGYWPWLALMLVVPTLQGMLTIGQWAMSVRVEFIRRANQISMIAVVIQYALSLSLVGPLGERSFILGHAIATALTFPLAVRQLADASGMSYPLVFRLMLKMLLPGLALAAVAAPLSIVIGSDAVTPNVAMLVLWCSIYWFICYRLVLDQDQRWFIWRLAELAGLRLSRRSL